jgi:hypothetical protein
MILAVIGVYALEQITKAFGVELSATALNSMAFAVGAFPMIVWEMLSGLAKRYSGIGFVLPSISRGIPLNELDGMTIWHETRLQDEDIENVVNFATADVIDLVLNIRFAPNRIIDWIDQAILLSIISGPDPCPVKVGLGSLGSSARCRRAESARPLRWRSYLRRAASTR